MSYSQTWLEDQSSIKAIFIETTISKSIDGGATWADYTLYLSTTGYLTEDSVVSFNPIINNGVSFTESLSLDSGSSSLSYGDVEILNPNGELDEWLDSTKYIWVNKSIKIYLGDPFWVSASMATFRSTFKVIFDGVIADIDSRSRTLLNIKFRDKLQRLNTALTEDKLGTYGTWANGQTNQDTIKPIVFGEVHNIEPLLIDPSTLEYMVNNGSTERIIEIRDNGVPIYTDKDTGTDLIDNTTVDLSTGKFTRSKPIAGTCTASLQGVKKSINLSNGTLLNSYSNNIANLIALIVTQYGNSALRFSASDLDLNNLGAFEVANPQPVGIYINSTENIISICEQLASSVGAQIFINREGKLQLLKLGSPITTGLAVTTITDNDILLHSFEVAEKLEVVAATKIGYCKNWTVQNDLISGIPPDHKMLFATEWLTTTTIDNTVKTLYSLRSDPVQKDTMLLADADASAEATRLNNYFKIPRIVYKFTGNSRLLSLQLGQQVTVTHNRFGLSGGKAGQIVSLSPNWLESKIEVGVII